MRNGIDQKDGLTLRNNFLSAICYMMHHSHHQDLDTCEFQLAIYNFSSREKGYVLKLLLGFQKLSWRIPLRATIASPQETSYNFQTATAKTSDFPIH